MTLERAKLILEVTILAGILLAGLYALYHDGHEQLLRVLSRG